LNEENSLRLEKAAREAVEAEKDTQRLLEKILRGSTGVTTLLVNLSQTSEPAVDSLHTIFTTEYGDEGEEDDSSIEEEGAEEKGAGLKILMRGFLKKKEDGQIEWSGSWAMTTEAFDTGDKAKFKYEANGNSTQFEKDGKVQQLPSSCTFDGSFLVKDSTASNGFVRVDEKGVSIKFEKLAGEASKWKVSGNGENIHGRFTLEGELDGATRRMAAYKTYARKSKTDSSSSESSDEAEEEEDVLDPTELDDLKADQQASFGMDFVPEKKRVPEDKNSPITETAPKKKKRTIDDDD